MHDYIKLHRKILNWEWYSDQNTFCLFLHLLLTARFDDGRWKGIPIKAGQLITSLSSLSKATGLSIKSVRTSLNHLKASGEVTDEATNRYRLITVINWALYQSNEDEAASQTASKEATKGQASGKQRASKGQQRNNGKNDKKERMEEYNVGSPEASPIVVKLIQNDGQFCEITQMQIDRWSELYPAVDVLTEVRKMAGWLEANKRKRKTKAGMARFCANWLARIQDQGKRIDADQKPQFV